MEQYILKAAVVAEIERRIKNLYPKGDQGIVVTKILKDHYKSLLSFLDTLEVKEVDFEKEIKKYSMELAMKENNGDWLKDITTTAKHFFELGLKVQKGINQ